MQENTEGHVSPWYTTSMKYKQREINLNIDIDSTEEGI